MLFYMKEGEKKGEERKGEDKEERKINDCIP
jgi:hypothetical protein